MEFPKRDRVTFTNLSDVRLILELTIRGINSINLTVSHLMELGAPINCRSAVTMRGEARDLAILMLSLLENFKRLHPEQCEKPLTCSYMSDEGMADYVERTESETVRIIRQLDEMAMKVELAGGVIDDPEIEIFDVTHLN